MPGKKVLTYNVTSLQYVLQFKSYTYTMTDKKPKSVKERVKDHRQRKKEGSQIYKLAINQAQLEIAKSFSEHQPEHAPEAILHLMIDQAFARFNCIAHEGGRLKELGASQEIVNQYCKNELKRLIPLTAEEFLQLINIEAKQ